MKSYTLNENEVRTVLAVFEEMAKMGYNKINCFLGSMTIDEMYELRRKMLNWYQLDRPGEEEW